MNRGSMVLFVFAVILGFAASSSSASLDPAIEKQSRDLLKGKIAFVTVTRIADQSFGGVDFYHQNSAGGIVIGLSGTQYLLTTLHTAKALSRLGAFLGAEAPNGSKSDARVVWPSRVERHDPNVEPDLALLKLTRSISNSPFTINDFVGEEGDEDDELLGAILIGPEPGKKVVKLTSLPRGVLDRKRGLWLFLNHPLEDGQSGTLAFDIVESKPVGLYSGHATVSLGGQEIPTGLFTTRSAMMVFLQGFLDSRAAHASR